MWEGVLAAPARDFSYRLAVVAEDGALVKWHGLPQARPVLGGGGEGEKPGAGARPRDAGASTCRPVAAQLCRSWMGAHAAWRHACGNQTPPPQTKTGDGATALPRRRRACAGHNVRRCWAVGDSGPSRGNKQAAVADCTASELPKRSVACRGERLSRRCRPLLPPPGPQG